MKFSRREVAALPVIGLLLSKRPAQAAKASPDMDWRNYASDLANTRYSPLDQIDATNFNNLQVAWRFKTEALGPHPEYMFEATPLVIKGRLYCTAGSRRDAICLDAQTGELLWMHREDEGARAAHAPRQLSGHGLAYWTDGTEERIFYVTIGYRLIALDASTGIPVAGFAANGVIDLKLDDDQDIDLVTSDIGLHATPLVAKGVVIVGAAHSSGAIPPPGHNVKGYARGFDAKTGKRLWIFHTVPRKGELGYETWKTPGQAEAIGNTGVWAQISVDEDLGLVYLPVELPTGDEVGILRSGPALFGESLVAVDLQTGERKWHYQLTHHGLWDWDISCAPILCDIPHNGRTVKALAQPTKQCFLYVLNRETGEPIWPIPERRFPPGDVPGEWYSPTQPVPTKPPAYDRQGVGPDDLIDFTPQLHAQALALTAHYHLGGLYAPPTLATGDGKWGTLTLPGNQGGTNWPGGCYDPETHKVYVYSKTVIISRGIIANQNPKASDFPYVRGTPGKAPQRGSPMGSADRPAADAGQISAPSDAEFTPGRVTIQGLPLVKPPYGRITAIDLEKGDIAWQIAHGETPDAIRNHPALAGIKIPRTGQAANLGPLATKTLIICGDGGYFTDPSGRRGARLRAYDKATGEERAAVFIPAPQTGAPMTYSVGGLQYIVLAVGGASYPAELIAFRIPA